MSRLGWLAAATLICTSFATAQAVMTVEQKCLSKRAVATGKYQLCVQRRLGKSYGDGGLDQARLSKCREKYAATWTKLQEKLIGSATCTLPRFVDNGSTVTDNLTGLVWEKKTTLVGSGVNLSDPNDVDNSYSWTNGDADKTDEDGTVFTDYLTGLNAAAGFDGANGWRQPTLAELMTLLNQPYPCTTGPCIDPIFGSTVSFSYWTASTALPDQIYAWTVSFNDGSVLFADKAGTEYTRAVRAGF